MSVQTNKNSKKIMSWFKCLRSRAKEMPLTVCLKAHLAAHVDYIAVVQMNVVTAQ